MIKLIDTPNFVINFNKINFKKAKDIEYVSKKIKPAGIFKTKRFTKPLPEPIREPKGRQVFGQKTEERNQKTKSLFDSKRKIF